MTANVWSPPNTNFVTQAAANGTLKYETVSAIEDQSVLYLNNFAYSVNTGSLLVFKNGVVLAPNIDYVESSETSVTLADAAEAGDLYTVIGFVGITGVVAVDELLRNDLAAATGAAIVGVRNDIVYPLNTIGARVPKRGVVGNNSQGYDHYRIEIYNDTLNGTNLGAGKVDGLNLTYSFGGTDCKGGRHGIEILTALTAATAADNPDRNYVGIAATGRADVPDNGVPGAAIGAVFGGNFVGCLNSGATDYLNVTGAEFNTACRTGASALIKTGIQICGFADDTVKGSLIDAMIGLSGQPGGAKWDNGIAFHPYNGADPIHATNGALIITHGEAVVKAGIDIRTYTCTSGAFLSKNFSVGSTGNLDIGALAASNVPQIAFHSSPTFNPYDGRIVCVGGTEGNGTGIIQIESAWLNVAGADIRLNSTRVVNDRELGWGVAINGSKSGFNGATATLAQTSAAVAAIIQSLTYHGLIGADNSNG